MPPGTTSLDRRVWTQAVATGTTCAMIALYTYRLMALPRSAASPPSDFVDDD